MFEGVKKLQTSKKTNDKRKGNARKSLFLRLRIKRSHVRIMPGVPGHETRLSLRQPSLFLISPSVLSIHPVQLRLPPILEGRRRNR
jgi:hypothetical protein